jgi:hypothetical protein
LPHRDALDTLATGCEDAIAGAIHKFVGVGCFKISDALLEFGVLVFEFDHAANSLEADTL